MKEYFSVNREIKSILFVGNESEELYDVAFAIPTYQRMDVLQRAIESCLNQITELRYEVVICDNTEDISIREKTAEMIRLYNNEDIRYYVNENNIGMFSNWNRVVELTHSKYVVMLHADDWLDAKYLSNVYKIIETYKMDWLSVRPHGRLFEEFQQDALIPVSYKLNTVGGFYPIQCSIFTKSSFMKSGGFSLDSYIDDLMFKKKFSFEYKVVQFNKELYWNGNDSGSASSNVDWETQLFYEYTYDMYSIEWRKGLIKLLYKWAEKYLILEKVKQINGGNSYFNNAKKIDEKDLSIKCGFKCKKSDGIASKIAIKFRHMDYKYNMNYAKRHIVLINYGKGIYK